MSSKCSAEKGMKNQGPAIPACPTMALPSQQTHFLNRSGTFSAQADTILTASCCSSVTLLLPCATARCLLPTSQLHSAQGHRGHPAPPSPVPPASAWRVWAQSTELTWDGRTLSPRTLLLDGPSNFVSHHREPGMDRRAARGSQLPQDCIPLHSWKEKFTEGKKEELRALLHAYR